MVGESFGHYRIIEKIARGGMGEVYRARDTRLDRDVALKVLPPDTATDPERVRRFEREAKAVAALKHPNIVTIHSVEEIDGRHCLTMELVEGKTLAEMIPPGGLPLDRFFDIAIPLADALSAAHAKGITHRDLKPSNVMVDADGRVKVLDFGLAKLFAGPEGEDATTLVGDEKVTAEGKILGTVYYMSPEQAEGKALDHRSDIFSLGVVLYEMAVGDRPFAGDTPISTISAILKDSPKPVTARKATLPRHLARVVGRCLEKNPEKRFQTARDVCTELEGLKKEVESGDVEQVVTASISRDDLVVARGRRGRGLWIGVAAAVVAAAAVAVALWKRPPATEGAHAVKTRPLTSLVGSEVAGSWSPDGSFFTYSYSAVGPVDIFIVSAAGGDPMRLVESPSDDYVPRWSPDNRWIAFVSNRDAMGAIYLVPPLGGTVQKLVETGFPPLSNANYGSLGANPWSPDGKALLIARRDANGTRALWKIDIESRAETQLTHPGEGEIDASGTWSFAGDRIAFCRVRDAASALCVMPAAGGEPREVHAEQTGYLAAAWTADDRGLVYSSETGGLWRVDVASGKRRQLTTGTTEGGPIVSRNGKILYSTFSHQTDLYVQDLRGEEAKRLTFHTLDNFGARFSPDGRAVAYASTRTGNAEIWLLDVATGNERQLTTREAGDWVPDWSPDGRELLFVSDAGGKSGIWTVRVDGGAPQRLGDFEVQSEARWSPDGAAIGFLAPSEEGDALFVTDRQASPPRKVLDGVDAFAWYRDAGHVVYRPSARDHGTELRAVDLASGREVVLLDAPHREVEVRRDGSALSYCSALSHFNMNLHVLRLNVPTTPDGLPGPAGPPEKITHGDGKWHVHNGGWSPDGTHVIYTRDTDTGDVYLLEGALAGAR